MAIREWYQVPNINDLSLVELQRFVEALNIVLLDISGRFNTTVSVSAPAVTATDIESGFGEPTTLTISSGTVSVTGDEKFRYHKIETEGMAASDNLTTVSGGNPGDLLLLEAFSDSRTVVCANGTSLNIGVDFSLDHSEDKLLLICKSSGIWHQLQRSSNA